MMVLNERASRWEDAIGMVTNADGSVEVVHPHDRGGRAAIQPAWNGTYGEVINVLLDAMLKSGAFWLEAFEKYQRGVIEDSLGFKEKSKAVAFVADNHFYVAGIGTHHKGAFLGYGGAIAQIVLENGEKYESNDVWHGGVVPVPHRKFLRTNATLKWGRA